MSDREHQRVTGTMWAGRRGESAAGKAKTGVTSSAEDQEAVDLAADWADISQGLRKDLGQQLFNQWIRPIQLGGFCKETGTLDLYLPTEFSANWVADRFADRLTLAWKITRDVRHVRISVHPGRRAMPELRLSRDPAPANDSVARALPPPPCRWAKWPAW
jgi:chromosomal replication initiator protein